MPDEPAPFMPRLEAIRARDTRGLAESLRGSTHQAARDTLLALLGDPDARDLAIVLAAEAPWPALLEPLTDIAEAEDSCARLAAFTIARCGALGGPAERAAAADCLYELLDDDATLVAAAVALIRLGHGFLGLREEARRLRSEAGLRCVVGMSLLAAEHAGNDSNARIRASAELLRMLLDNHDEPTQRAMKEMCSTLETVLKATQTWPG